MGIDDNQPNIKVEVVPEFNKDQEITGLYIFADGFILVGENMVYKSYTLLITLADDPSGFMLDRDTYIGSEVSLDFEDENVLLEDITFIVTKEIAEFCEEWKDKNAKIIYWDDSENNEIICAN